MRLQYLNTFSIFTPTNNDAPEPWGLFFNDTATPQMEGLEELHNNIMFYLAITLFAVSWITLSTLYSYKKASRYENQGPLVELIWTITPRLIFMLIAFIFVFYTGITDPSSGAITENSSFPMNWGLINNPATEIDLRIYRPRDLPDLPHVRDTYQSSGAKLIDKLQWQTGAKPPLVRCGNYHGFQIPGQSTREFVVINGETYSGFYALFRFSHDAWVTSYYMPLHRNAAGDMFIIWKKEIL